MRFAFLTAAVLLLSCSGQVREARPPRAAGTIVSLVPSLTEDLCAIGAGSKLAAVSSYSSGAPCAKGLPRVADASGIDAERIVALHPSLVVGIPAQRASLQPIVRAGLKTAFLRDDTYSDLFDDIRVLGNLSGRAPAARRLVARLQRETRGLESSEHFSRRPTVFVVLQAFPIWTVGPQSYISTLIMLAGGRNAVSSLGAAYSQYSAEALVRLQPDVVVTSSDTGLLRMLDRAPWRSLRAVREHHVYAIADPALLERPGPRYVAGVAWLIARLRATAQ